MNRYLSWLLLACAGSATAVAAPVVKSEPPPVFDIAEIKPKLVVFTDAKKHYLALVLTKNSDSPVFWSDDGKDFYRLRISSGGSEGGDDNLIRLDHAFWDPRAPAPFQASFEYKKDKDAVSVQCATRMTSLKPLPAAEEQKLVDSARFFQARWNHRAYALARDSTGKYYYVDRQREPEESKSFRLWAGPKGGLKPQKMVNVVSDSQGDIFSTRTGELRLIVGKQETTWIQHEKPIKLTWVPVEDNHVLIYTDLGVYAGEPLGTPCDDL